MLKMLIIINVINSIMFTKQNVAVFHSNGNLIDPKCPLLSIDTVLVVIVTLFEIILGYM